MIAPYFPAPENTGGRIRMAQLARALANTHEVELFACGGEREVSEAQRDGSLSIYAGHHVRGRKPGRYPFAWMAPERVRSASPVALVWDLARAHRARPFDGVFVCHSYAMGLALPLGLAVVLDEHNVESDYAAQTRLDAASARESERLRAWERMCWQTARLVTCVSETDAACVRESLGAQGTVAVVPNGVSLESVDFCTPSERASAGRRDVLFVGLMSHPPNERAAVWLVDKVFARVWRSVADARLVLCGRQPSATVQALAKSDPRIVVTGTVPSVRLFLQQARVVTVPLGHGAGSSLKSVEALASGAHVVSTPVGMRGISGTQPGLTHAETDDPDAFADEIIRGFSQDISVLAALDAQALRAREVARAYDWPTIGARFAQLATEHWSQSAVRPR